MGTWDAGSFGNDTGGDWSYGLRAVNDLAYVETALDEVLGYGSTIAVPGESAESAVAAAEVIARLRGQWGEESAYSETVDHWVREHPIMPPQRLVTKAIDALNRLVIPPSQLLDLWNESGDADGWIEAVAELRQRVGQA